MSAQTLLEEMAALGIELRADGADLEYEGPEEAITPELLDTLRRHKKELLSLLTWDEDEACELIKDALAYLCERHVKAGKPDFDLAAMNGEYDRIDEAYRAEDMGELRRAVRAFVVASLKEFSRRRRTA